MTGNSNVSAEYQRARLLAEASPRDATAAFNHGWWAARIGAFSESINAYSRAIELGLDGAEEAMTNIASVYSERLGRAEDALGWLAKALALNPNYFPAVFNRAHLAEQMGDRDAAVLGFERALALKPGDALSLARLAEAMVVLEDKDPVLTQLRVVAEAGDPDVLLSLAKAEERLGHYRAAWTAMQRANAADRARMRPWPSHTVRERIMGYWAGGVSGVGNALEHDTDQQLASDRGVANSSNPVFIVGSFRTGSTLLEQVLAAHSAFTPLGESEYWPRQIAATGGGMVLPGRMPDEGALAQMNIGFYQHVTDRGISPDVRVTDKRPDNLFHLPLIARAMPEAQFLITQRDWRDVLLSIYGTRLHPQHGYAVDVDKIRDNLRLCRELADKYQKIWPNKVRAVDYERLVECPEQELASVLTWLGEAWEPTCLEFHRLDNSVRTASVWQVREPLSKSRLGRWRHYEPWLREALGDDLDHASP